MILEPGVHTISLDDYLNDPAPLPSLSSHVAHELLTRSPAHAWALHPRLNARYRPETSPEMELGTVAHQLVLGMPVTLDVLPFDNYRTKAAQVRRQHARECGEIPLLMAQHAELMAMVAAWREAFQRLDPVPFVGGTPEQTLLWQEGEVWCRTRPDYLYAWGADDLKTTSTSAAPDEWARRRLWDGYDLQAALFLLGAKALRITAPSVFSGPPDFRFIVCETTAPYGVSAIALDPEAQAFALDRARHAIARWGECQAAGYWPGYRRETAFAEIPPWIKAAWSLRPYYEEAR